MRRTLDEMIAAKASWKSAYMAIAVPTHSNVLNDKMKQDSVIFTHHILRFLAEPLISLIYLMTLSIYPSALRY